MKRLVLLVLCALLSVISSNAAKIYWVTFHPADNIPSATAAGNGFTNAPDAGYTRLLRDNGHNVIRVVSADNFNVNQLTGADLVIISRSVASGHYQATNETSAWNGLPVPTIILGGYVLRGGTTAGNVRLGYMTGSSIPDTDGPIRLTALVPNHPIFAGISLDGADTMVNTYATSGTNGTIAGPGTSGLQRGISVVTNPPTAGATVLARVAADPNTAGGLIIGEWQAGAVLDTAGRGGGATNDVLGGHRLVFLTGTREFGGVSADGAGIFDLTADGAQMFLNAVNYMAGTTPGRILTVNTTNNESPGVGETSLLQALTGLQNGDFVRFNIPGPGPHVIVTPLGGYPLITAHNVTIDGYTQPGSVPNTNSILGGNNAQIKIILDSTGSDTAPNTNNPALPLRRSTRLDFPTFVGNTGYGGSENGMLGVFGADNVTIRGLSFIARRTPGSDDDPSIYAVALVREATNARVQGCWSGLAPGAGTNLSDVKPAASALAAFRWRIDGDVFSGGAIVGTDGDGFGDRAEFNVIIGGRISLAIEAPNLRVSGNYVNVFPNGTNFLDIDASYRLWYDVFDGDGNPDTDPGDVTVENLENGRFAINTTIGTDGNGVSDADERNIFNHAVYDHELEFYSDPATNIVIAGNYFGVGINGTTFAPLSTNAQPDFLDPPGVASVRIGSNGDGVSDDLEGNLIANGPGQIFVVAGSSVPIVARRNRMMNNNYLGVPFVEPQEGRLYATYYANVVADPSMVVPVLRSFTNNLLSGSMIGPNGVDYIAAFIDVYEVDPAALAKAHNWPYPITHPLRLLLSTTDNGAADLDPAANQFTFNLSSFGLSDTAYLTLAVTYSKEAAASNVGQAVTGPTANPISRRPTLHVDSIVPRSKITLSWLAYDGAYRVQSRIAVDQGQIQDHTNYTYTAGRNIAEIDVDPFTDTQFYWLISQ